MKPNKPRTKIKIMPRSHVDVFPDDALPGETQEQFEKRVFGKHPVKDATPDSPEIVVLLDHKGRN
jgi:hypothetical protein